MAKSIYFLLIILNLGSCANSQNHRDQEVVPRLVGKPCEGCEAILEFGNQILSAMDTLPDYDDKGMKLKVTGTIFENDGHTPAKNVILYIYHTDQNGIYATKGDETGWGKRHGYLRGWIKTDSDGKYTFYTLKPAAYPNRSASAHIHATVLEPNGKYYWLQSFVFEGDTLLTKEEFDPESPRGGNTGVLNLTKKGDIWVGKRDIVLGKNIPGYE